VVDEVELSLLDAGNVASGMRQSGMHRVFPSLIVQPTDVSADNVKEKDYHRNSLLCNGVAETKQQ
jgi:hypothetical protein